jgi:hypothetical protein
MYVTLNANKEPEAPANCRDMQMAANHLLKLLNSSVTIRITLQKKTFPTFSARLRAFHWKWSQNILLGPRGGNCMS